MRFSIHNQFCFSKRDDEPQWAREHTNWALCFKVIRDSFSLNFQEYNLCFIQILSKVQQHYYWRWFMSLSFSQKNVYSFDFGLYLTLKFSCIIYCKVYEDFVFRKKPEHIKIKKLVAYNVYILYSILTVTIQ